MRMFIYRGLQQRCLVDEVNTYETDNNSYYNKYANQVLKEYEMLHLL